jgi:hypothetical protein
VLAWEAIVLRSLPVLLVLAVAISCFAQKREMLTILKSEPQVVQQHLIPPPATQKERLRALSIQFRKARDYGLGPVEVQPVPDQQQPNLICTIQGTTESTIVVGVNANYKSTGEQAKIKWANVVLLPLIAESLGPVVPKHTLVFVAFSGDKGKHSGANWYLHQLTEAQRKHVDAVIELYSLGQTPTSYAPNSKGDKLARPLLGVARGLKLEEPRQHALDSVGFGTPSTGPLSEEFGAAKIAGITIHSLERIPIPEKEINGHKFYRGDGTFDFGVYYDSYLLLCMYVRQLDRLVSGPS